MMNASGAPLTISTLSKPITVLTFSLFITLIFIFNSNPNPNPSPNSDQMSTGRAKSFILWLHGLGDSGPANEPIKNLFTSPQFNSSKWSFPSAPPNPVTCNRGAVMPSWFDIPEILSAKIKCNNMTRGSVASDTLPLAAIFVFLPRFCLWV